MRFKLKSWKFVALVGLVVSMAAPAEMRNFPEGVTVLPLAGITNDRDTSVSHLNLLVDGQAAVRGIYMETDVPGKLAGTQSGKPVDAHVYSLQNIESPEGVVLGQGSGVKAILLRGTIDSRAGHGSLVVRYLTNGLLMSYHECKLDLQKMDSSDWRLINAYDGRPVTQIKVKTWMLGISTLKNVCPAAST